jgi:hypothetical protein
MSAYLTDTHAGSHPDGPIRDDESAGLPAGSEQAENLLTSPE